MPWIVKDPSCVSTERQTGKTNKTVRERHPSEMLLLRTTNDETLTSITAPSGGDMRTANYRYEDRSRGLVAA